MNRARLRFWLLTIVSAVSWIVAGVLIGVGWQGYTSALCGPFHSATAAGWVQALGSLLAITVAIYVPYKLAADARRGREAERRLRSRLVATKLLIPTLTLQHEAMKAAVRLRPLPDGVDRNAPAYWDHGQPLRLDDVESIKREWGDFAHLSGELPDMFAVLIATADGYNRRLDTLTSQRHIPHSKLLWERDGPRLALIADSVANIAQQAFDAAHNESVLKLPAALVARTGTSSGSPEAVGVDQRG